MAKKEITEVIRLDEDTVSKAATGDEPVESSSLSTSSDVEEVYQAQELVFEELTEFHEKRPRKKIENPVKRFKLNYRRPNGTIRAEISKSVIYNLNVHWPDLVRVIPSDRYVSMDEIAELVSAWENSSPKKSITRSREAIETGVNYLLEAGILLHT